MSSRNEPEVHKIRVRDLEPGYVVARAVYNKDGCRLMLPGTTLDQQNIRKLEGWGKRAVHVYDPDDLDEFDDHPFAQAS